MNYTDKRPSYGIHIALCIKISKKNNTLGSKLENLSIWSEKKMRCLIGQFQREQKNAKSETATGADEVYCSKWFALRLAYVVVSRIMR